tara:strand:+ start:1099 stop:1692 length:594 start_codon:yes stop_codon:yes gene_type:complete
MLGSIDTGGFSEAGKAAMMDSDYFNPKKRSKGFASGARDFLGQAINDAFIDKESPYYFDQKKKSYREEEKASLEDRIAQYLDKVESGGGGAFSNVGPGFFVSNPDNSARDAAILQQNQFNAQQEAQAKQNKTNTGRMAGTAIGSLVGGPVGGAIGGFIGGLFCDIRLKEDIAPLCVSEVNDVLSECAFFVKNLNECS